MNPQSVAVSYGALELKRAYQHNLLLGLFLAVALHVAVLGTVAIYRSLQSVPIALPAPPDGGVIILRHYPPPSWEPVPLEPPSATSTVTPPPVGIPRPVPDAEVTEDVHVWTARDRAPGTPAGDLPGGGINGAIDSVSFDIGDYLPAPTEFVATDELPVCVHFETPVFPDMARLTNREGTVVVSALVDKEGKVLRVIVLKPSGSDLGFEDAALAAVAKNRYKPAIQNGLPVAVWVTHRVEFKLK